MMNGGAPRPPAPGERDGMAMDKIVLPAEAIVRAMRASTVVGSVEVAVAGHIRRVVTKHKKQATADDDIPPTGRRRIGWQQLPLFVLEGKAGAAAALVRVQVII